MKNERYEIGVYLSKYGLWHNYDEYIPIFTFVIDNVFVYVDNNCVKNKWYVGTEPSYMFDDVRKIIDA